MEIVLANWLEIAATVTCTTCLLYKPSIANKWFVGLLWLTLIVELNGKLSNDNLCLKYGVYNVFTLVEFLWYAFFFHKITSRNITKVLINVSGVILLIFFLYNIFFGQGFCEYNHRTTVFASSLLVMLCLLQYTETIQSEKPKFSKWSLLFFTTGVFIFYTGTFRIYVSYDYLVKNTPQQVVWLYKLIVSNLNVILYGLFSIGFILEVLESSNNKKVEFKRTIE